jgi:L-arabinose isomerase
MNTNQKEIWLLTGSQHLYGPDTLRQVAQNVQAITGGLNESGRIPLNIVAQSVVTSPEEITAICRAADSSPNCVGVIAWMHTFSPAKMWIAGLTTLRKPLCQLHTQFNAEIPWSEIDMDFMNLNQSAHGDREFGYILTRMRRNRKVVVGHWQEAGLQQKLGNWSRVCLGQHELQTLKVARFGDNMREVAVTEGDKVAAQLQFGFSVNGYDSSDITDRIADINDEELNIVLAEYEANYTLSAALLSGGSKREALKDAARIEIALRGFLDAGDFKAFTTTFENLGALRQLPGIAVQRLMADGYGFGAEGDWKTAALLRALKVMGQGLEGGTSFMEDYTYHFCREKGMVLGAHMLEICPSITGEKPTCEIHPLGIGNRQDPVRLVFDGKAGPAINVSLIDLGNRFRFIVNEVTAFNPPHELPKLPVARAFWEPMPSLATGAEAWLLAGGAHHTVYSQSITTEFMEDLADMLGIELLVIDADTQIRDFKNLIRSNEVYYHNFRPMP